MTIKPSARPLILFCVLEGLVAAAILVSAILWYPDYLMYAVIAVLVLSLLAVPRVLRMKATTLTIADGRLHYEHGILSKTTRTMELRKVQDVRVDQTFGQRLMGMGDLSVETAGETGHITIRGIDNPRQPADYILQLSRGKTAGA